MPLTEKGKEIMGNMKQEYGPEKGEEVFYASKNKGTIAGVDNPLHDTVHGIDNIAKGTDIAPSEVAPKDAFKLDLP